MLKPRHGYILKVLSTPFRAQVITLSALSPSEQDQGLNLLCPVRALRIYIEHSGPFRQSEQLCACFGGRTKLSIWIIDAIMLAYSSFGQLCPMGVRDTRLEASSRSGRGLAMCPLQRYVWRPYGPRHSHLPGFIIWKFRPYRPMSFLHNGLTLVIWQTSMGVCLLLVCSWPSIELRGCTDVFGMITQGWVDLYEYDPITFCRASLYNSLDPSGPLLMSKASSSVGRSPSIDTAGLYWFP